MILISHRGNINGKNSEKENHPDYILKALKMNYNVEVDVWYKNNELYLGHDNPQYKIHNDFLKNEKIWCHAPNIAALNYLDKIDCHYFWHQEDDVTITNRGYFWTYPGKNLTEKSICVLPEISNYEKILCAGICSDFIENYNK